MLDTKTTREPVFSLAKFSNPSTALFLLTQTSNYISRRDEKSTNKKFFALGVLIELTNLQGLLVK